MPTPSASAVYQADADVQGTAALAILVSLLRTLAQKGSLTPDDVDAVLLRAESSQGNQPIERRKNSAAVIRQMRDLV